MYHQFKFPSVRNVHVLYSYLRFKGKIDRNNINVKVAIFLYDNEEDLSCSNPNFYKSYTKHVEWNITRWKNNEFYMSSDISSLIQHAIDMRDQYVAFDNNIIVTLGVQPLGDKISGAWLKVHDFDLDIFYHDSAPSKFFCHVFQLVILLLICYQ